MKIALLGLAFAASLVASQAQAQWIQQPNYAGTGYQGVGALPLPAQGFVQPPVQQQIYQPFYVPQSPQLPTTIPTNPSFNCMTIGFMTHCN